MKKSKVYTRSGDQGSSQLLSVGRVAKDHLRLCAYGDIDELNSVIGVAVAGGLTGSLPAQLLEIQQALFVLGSQIAVPDPEKAGFPIPQIEARHTEKLEHYIDVMDADLPTLKNFILPGGSPGSANLHLARTVCRRCERNLQSLNAAEALAPPVLTYINRLSDYLFVAARHENAAGGVADITWNA